MKFVVIGASAAGINAVRKLRELNPEAEIVLISEDEAVYSRCILYHHLKGIRDLKGLNFVEERFMEDHRVCWVRGVKASGVDVERKAVLLEDGREEGFDRLCIATGSHTNFPPIPGLWEGKNIVGFRNFSDVEAIEKRLPEVENIFIMGAGLVGIDAVAGLLPFKKKITLVDMGPHMLPLQLDAYAAKTYEERFAAEGVEQYYKTGVSEFVLDENGLCRKVILQDGQVIPTDLVINCAGVRANVEFLKGSGIACDRYGLVFDEYGRTSVPDIYGAGDVSGRNPIWPAAVKEGMIAAYNMSGKAVDMDDFFASKSTMNFLGIPSLSLGNVNAGGENCREEIWRDEKKGIYKKMIHQDGVIVGAILQGDISYSGVLTQLIRREIDVSKVKKPIFDIDYSDFFHMDDNFEYFY